MSSDQNINQVRDMLQQLKDQGLIEMSDNPKTVDPDKRLDIKSTRKKKPPRDA